jgi:hypothetical protein
MNMATTRDIRANTDNRTGLASEPGTLTHSYPVAVSGYGGDAPKSAFAPCFTAVRGEGVEPSRSFELQILRTVTPTENKGDSAQEPIPAVWPPSVNSGIDAADVIDLTTARLLVRARELVREAEELARR